MKKIETDYIEKYNNIPRDDMDRFGYLLSNTRLNKKTKFEIFKRINHILNIKWKTLDFIIYLVPKATPRPRYNMVKNTFYVTGAKDNKDIFSKFISKYDIDIIKTPCKFTCVSYLPIPNGMNKLEKIFAEMGLISPITKPDWDNLGKTYSDMIQDLLLLDDSLIIDGRSKKLYSMKPRIEIHIEYMDEYDSIYNMEKIRKKVNKK